MPESSLCPQCGLTLRADAPEGLCPECLILEAMQTVSDCGFQQESHGGGSAPTSEPPAKLRARLESFVLSHQSK